ncbi:MAG: hypothetical protein WCI72_00220 [archaeon]
MAGFQEKMEVIRDLKRFAVHELGIYPNHAFERMGREKDVYVLYVSEPDCIKSTIKGRECCEIFNSRAERHAAARKWVNEGKDILKVDSPACSTSYLITKQLLEATDCGKAYTLFHEQFHVHCEKKPVKLKMDIEESAADVFAYQAASEFFKGDSKLQEESKKFLLDEFPFDNLLTEYLHRLDIAYAHSYNAGREVLAEAKEVIPRSLFVPKRLNSKTDRVTLEKEINNAFFVMKRVYSPKSERVYVLLKDINPRDYLLDSSLLTRLS